MNIRCWPVVRRAYILRTAFSIVLLAIAGWACDPIVTVFDDVEEAVYYQADNINSAPTSVDSLVVMTWNIKYGGGDIDFWWACYDDRVLMTEDEVLANLDSLVAYIDVVDPDVLLLQEVDVGSKRAGYVNQMQYILDNTSGLNYGVYASMWQVQFAPSDGLGRADLGPAILSRWPLHEGERIGLDLRTDQDALTTYFYIRRCIVKARIDIPLLEDFYALTVHTAAWSQDGTKIRHIDRFKSELQQLADEQSWFVAGGDLNTIPPGSAMTHNFPDSKCEEGDFEGDDYRDELQLGVLDELYERYPSAISLSEYQQAGDQSPYFTYGDKPDSLGFTRKLDYLFTNLDWIDGSAHTHIGIASGGRTLSDHAPVSAILSLTGTP
ncbi:MAG: endonuclease/exonuclease/phosphatase family protein [Fidelibacterota bacterium]|nr:MAG: endonuclease/exonuclease/phosphatase family protein [Candidatus Neomarinimicrobiota bacterium]